MAAKSVLRTPRIGVDYAGPVWAKRKLRPCTGSSGTLILDAEDRTATFHNTARIQAVLRVE